MDDDIAMEGPCEGHCSAEEGRPEYGSFLPLCRIWRGCIATEKMTLACNMKALKLAVFVGEFPIISETFVMRQVTGLIDAGHDVTVIAGKWGDRSCTHHSYTAYGLEKRITSIRMGDDTGWTKVKNLCGLASPSLFVGSAWRGLMACVRAALHGSLTSLVDIGALAARPSSRRHLGRYDAIIAHFGPAGVRAMYLEKVGLLTGPLAVVFHGLDMSDRTTLARHAKSYQDLFLHAAMLLPISDLWRDRLVEWGATPGKIRVLRMGVDLDRLNMLDPARPLHRPLRVLSVARFTEKKGLRYAIEGVMAAQGSVHYEIIGAGPLEQELKALAANAPVGKEIVFLGKKAQHEVFERLDEADLFLLPSVTAADGDMEGIPVALMEAMAKGLLVLATRHSGIPELVTHERSGLLVPERDASAIAAAIDALRDSDTLVASIRREARKVVESEFNNALLDKQCEEICEQLAGSLRSTERAALQEGG